MELFGLFGLIYAVYLMYVIIVVLISTFKRRENEEGPFSRIVLAISEIIFTIIGPYIGFMRYDAYGPEIPFAKQHIITIIFLVIVSSASFWISRLTHKLNNPYVRIILSVGLLEGIILCFFTTIHFLNFIPMGISFPLFGFELLAPLMVLLFLIRQFYFYNKTEYDLNELLPYRAELGFVPLPYKIFQLPLFSRLLVYALLLIPFLALQIAFLYACGQDIDALVKAFTHSVGFVFSMKN